MWLSPRRPHSCSPCKACSRRRCWLSWVPCRCLFECPGCRPFQYPWTRSTPCLDCSRCRWLRCLTSLRYQCLYHTSRCHTPSINLSQWPFNTSLYRKVPTSHASHYRRRVSWQCRPHQANWAYSYSIHQRSLRQTSLAIGQYYMTSYFSACLRVLWLWRVACAWRCVQHGLVLSSGMSYLVTSWRHDFLMRY